MVKTYAFNKKYNATSHKVLFQCEILRAKFLCTYYFLRDNFNFIYVRKLLLASKKNWTSMSQAKLAPGPTSICTLPFSSKVYTIN